MSTMASPAELTAIESDLRKELHEKKQQLLLLVLYPTFSPQENLELESLTIEARGIQERLDSVFNQINN